MIVKNYKYLSRKYIKLKPNKIITPDIKYKRLKPNKIMNMNYDLSELNDFAFQELKPQKKHRKKNLLKEIYEYYTERKSNIYARFPEQNHIKFYSIEDDDLLREYKYPKIARIFKQKFNL